jgi:hypothetical protein
MRALKIIPVIVFLLFVLEFPVHNVKLLLKEMPAKLSGYTHDGNYMQLLLVEGEEAELYKDILFSMDYWVE